MNHFVITKDPENNPFDRQERIEWWSQETLKKARVLVIGAGAIGNETLKNLALLGIGNILVCDMDTISVSNLSRTVLFRREDAGKKKAQTAALRTKEMSLEPDCAVDFFDGDVVWELGTGVFRYFDVVLGCLDNVETRFAINKNCHYVCKPWIDAGISELAGSIKVFGVGDECACYQCFASEEEYKQLRKRYSCDDFKKRMFSESKMPTVQISSAIVSALQVQEAIKIILGKQALTGKKIFFQGTIGEFELIKLRRDPKCLAHASYGDIIDTPLTNKATVRDLLDYASKGGMKSPVLMLDRMFLNSAECSKCGKTSNFLSPVYRLYIDEVKCAHCGTSSDRNKLNYVSELSYDSGRLLDMTLEQVGVPKLHIVAIRANSDVKYYELSADIPNVMPKISAKES